VFFPLDVSYLQVKRIANHTYAKYLAAECGLEDLGGTFLCTITYRSPPDACPASVPGVNRLEPVADHLPPPSAEIRKACVYFSSYTDFLLPYFAFKELARVGFTLYVLLYSGELTSHETLQRTRNWKHKTWETDTSKITYVERYDV
jgi:hypothetical protein